MPPEIPLNASSEEMTGVDLAASNPDVTPTELARETRPPATYKMRCPRCQRLYSVQAQVLLAASLPLQFQCQSCQTRFETPVLSMRDLYNEILTTTEIAPLHPAEAKSGEGEATCPKCRGRNAFDAAECRHCGIVFEKFAKAVRSDQLEELGGRRELAEAWENLLEDYNNLEVHESFVEECYKADALAFAARRYSRILGAAPNEEIAKGMRRRIIALASFKAETGKSSDEEKSVSRDSTSLLSHLKVTHVVFMVGGALMALGFLLPAAKDLIGLGLAMIMLAMGVRYFRPKV